MTLVVRGTMDEEGGGEALMRPTKPATTSKPTRPVWKRLSAGSYTARRLRIHRECDKRDGCDPWVVTLYDDSESGYVLRETWHGLHSLADAKEFAATVRADDEGGQE